MLNTQKMLSSVGWCNSEKRYGIMFLDDFIQLFTENEERMNRNMVYEFFGNVGQQFMIPAQPVKYMLSIEDESPKNNTQSRW